MGLPCDSINYHIERSLRLEAKLRELVEAAEWRDECQGAKDHCFWRREDYADRSDGWNRWDHSVVMAMDNLDRAEADYQAALKAAKED